MGYDSRFKSQVMDEFFEAILLLKNQEECYRFFEDVCTINELRAMTQRMQVAKLLAEKKTYREIEEITKPSTATISRINRCLVYGAGGYELVIDRLKDKDTE